MEAKELIGTQSRTSTLVARDLKKSYDGFEAVKGVDFEVHRGECFGFLGPNGAGKTTTMKMIYGAVIPTSGELDVAGLDVRRCEREIKRRIGVVPQENNLDDELKVKENLLVCDRLVIMEGGLIIAEGAPGELVERHVSPQVLEFRGSPESLERLRPVVEAASDAVERSGEALLAFTTDGEALLREVHASGIEVDNSVYRQAGLEDVFLRLTGR